MTLSKAFLLLFISFVFSSKILAQDAYFDWAKQLDRRTGLSGEEAYFIGVDAAKNVYLVGNFRNTIDLDPGAGVLNVTSTWDHVFVVKLDPLGNFIWGKDIGGDRFTLCRALNVDANGNVYVAGRFSGTTDFDPGTATHNLTATPILGQENYDIFTLKLDTDGNFKWATSAGDLNADMANSITVDIAGNVYTTGYFIGVVDFDPGSGTFALGTNGRASTFVTKFDSVGNFGWAKSYVGNFDNYGVCIKTDNFGNIYTSGTFEGTIDFDPGPVVHALTVPFYSKTPYLCKLDSKGNFVWVKQNMGGNGFDVDAYQQVVTNTRTPAMTGILSKYDVNGDEIWSKVIGGRPWGNDLGNSCMKLDAAGNIFLTGEFNYTRDFDPGSGVYNMTAAGGAYDYDAFITRLNANGDLVWAKQFGNYSEEHPTSLSLDTSGNIYTTGIYNFTVDFDPGPGVFNLTSYSGGGIYIHKMSRCANATYTTLKVNSCSSYTLNNTTYTQPGTYFQTLVNKSGCDSIITLNLKIQNAATNITATACDHFIWNNKELTKSGLYTDTLTSIGGCDSIIHLQLTIRKKSFIDMIVSICEGAQYAGYSTSGNYIDTFTSSNQCDSIRTLHLTVTAKKYSSLTSVICEGQVYLGHSVAGTYIDTLTATSGCDSVRTLYLTVKRRLFTTIDYTICSGQSYLGYQLSGTYTDTFTASNGCDSIRSLNLKVIPKIISASSKVLCIGEAYLGHTSSGTYTDTLHTLSGCDSIVKTTIVVQSKPAPYLSPNIEICSGDSIILNPGSFLSYRWQDGSTLNQLVAKHAGLYDVTVTNACGAGSIATLISDKMCQYYFPTAFTPNDDGKNDSFKILNPFNLKNFDLCVYNRFGQKIFETNNYSVGWDGMYKGVPTETGAYIWRCSFDEAGLERKLKGTILLLR